MIEVYTGEDCDFSNLMSVFLAGPSPRDSSVKSWRKTALDLLYSWDFSSIVLIPEFRSPREFIYNDQVEWEHKMLNKATVILFWVPRDLRTLPGFTTNIEFGRFVGVKRCVYGRPDDAPKCEYLDWYYTKVTGKKPCNNLWDTLKEAIYPQQVPCPWAGG